MSADMKAGSELDQRIALQVMGWQRGRRYGNGNGEWIIPGHVGLPVTWDQTPCYSLDIADAWLVVEKLRAGGAFTFDLSSCGDEWSVLFDAMQTAYAKTGRTAATPSLAICLAALAVTEALEKLNRKPS